MERNTCREIEKGPGYTVNTNAFETYEFENIKDAIVKQYSERIKEFSNESWEKILDRHLRENFPPISYHQISRYLHHSSAWPKLQRVLPQSFYEYFIKTNFFKEIKSTYKNPIITDEEGLGYGNIYWRIVRPNEGKDIGSLHQDSWFWEIDKDQELPLYNFKRIKTWISVNTEPGKNGLIVIPDSQKEEAEWSTIEKHGRTKPMLLEEEKFEKRKKLLITDKNTAVLFHDKLIHGGSINKGEETRVSLEFTCFVNDD